MRPLWDGSAGPRAGDAPLRAAVAVVHGGRILVVRHSYRPGWSLPGGRVRRGETPEACARRELREEVGLDAPRGGLRSVYATLSLRIFEWRPERAPDPVADGREVVEARFRPPEGIAGPDEILRAYLLCRIP